MFNYSKEATKVGEATKCEDKIDIGWHYAHNTKSTDKAWVYTKENNNLATGWSLLKENENK